MLHFWSVEINTIFNEYDMLKDLTGKYAQKNVIFMPF
jgi:hypothetical protein